MQVATAALDLALPMGLPHIELFHDELHALVSSVFLYERGVAGLASGKMTGKWTGRLWTTNFGGTSIVCLFVSHFPLHCLSTGLR